MERREEVSDASTRSGSPSSSSADSETGRRRQKAEEASTSPVTLSDLGLELLNTPPSTSSASLPPCILGSMPKRRARPSIIAVPGDASERTPLATPMTDSRPPAALPRTGGYAAPLDPIMATVRRRSTGRQPEPCHRMPPTVAGRQAHPAPRKISSAPEVHWPREPLDQMPLSARRWACLQERRVQRAKRVSSALLRPPRLRQCQVVMHLSEDSQRLQRCHHLP